MRETDFIKQNKDKWGRFEKVLRSDSKNAEELSRLFVESTDDLSFSRTYYPNRSVRIYLNGMAQQIYHRIYKNRRRESGAFRRFWVEELPDSMWAARKSLLIAFLIFIGGVALGLFSSNQNPEFVRTILGDQYVEMTEANIQKGDPMAVYKDSGALEMFFEIGWNNIRVSFLCFLAGLLFEVGTIFIVGSNAVMVGAFLYFFIERDLFKESFLAIMLHGSLELSMIVLAGAAGLTLGRGLVFPGDLSRSQALLLSARQGMRMMVGVTFFLVIAAFIESYATRHTEVPDIVRVAIIVLSFFIVLWYFVIYPYKRYRTNLNRIDDEIENAIPPIPKIELNAIKKTGQLMSESWRLLFDKLSSFALLALGIGGIIVVFNYAFSDLMVAAAQENGLKFDDELLNLLNGFWFYDDLNNYFSFLDFPLLFALIVSLTSMVLYQSAMVFKKTTPNYTGSHSNTLIFLNALITSVLMQSIFFLPSIVDAVALVILWPILLLVFASSNFNRQLVFTSFGALASLLADTKAKIYQLFAVQVFMTTVAMGVMSAPLFYLIFQIIGSQFTGLDDSDELFNLIFAFFMFSLTGLLFIVFVYSSFLLFFSNKEITEAHELKARIGKITLKKSAYGLEKEA